MTTIELIDNRPIHEKEGVEEGYRVVLRQHSEPANTTEQERLSRIFVGLRTEAERNKIKEFRYIFCGDPFSIDYGMKLVVREEDYAHVCELFSSLT